MNRVNFHNKSFKLVSHVIFDLDGLLLDTEKIYKKAISDIAKKYGKIYTPEIMSKVVGTPELESSRIAVEEMKLPMTPKDFQKQFRSLSHQQFTGIVPFMPGAAQLITHLSSNNIPIAVATSSSMDSFCLKTKRHTDLFALFDHVVTGGSDPEVKRGKPSPDIFLVCASRFTPPAEPKDCLVFEDAPNGVKAAIDAGMQVVMVPDTQTSPELCQNATLQLSSLEEIQLELFGLPPLTLPATAS